MDDTIVTCQVPHCSQVTPSADAIYCAMHDDVEVFQCVTCKRQESYVDGQDCVRCAVRG